MAYLLSGQRLVLLLGNHFSRERRDGFFNEALRRFIRPQQRLHFQSQRLIVPAGDGEESGALFRLALQSRFQQLIDLSPTLRFHLIHPLLIARRNQALAFRHSRSIVRSDIPITSPTSSLVRPPKNRNSTIRLLLKSKSARSLSASSRAINSAARSAETIAVSSNDT